MIPATSFRRTVKPTQAKSEGMTPSIRSRPKSEMNARPIPTTKWETRAGLIPATKPAKTAASIRATKSSTNAPQIPSPTKTTMGRLIKPAWCLSTKAATSTLLNPLSTKLAPSATGNGKIQAIATSAKVRCRIQSIKATTFVKSNPISTAAMPSSTRAATSAKNVPISTGKLARPMPSSIRTTLPSTKPVSTSILSPKPLIPSAKIATSAKNVPIITGKLANSTRPMPSSIRTTLPSTKPASTSILSAKPLIPSAKIATSAKNVPISTSKLAKSTRPMPSSIRTNLPSTKTASTSMPSAKLPSTKIVTSAKKVSISTGNSIRSARPMPSSIRTTLASTKPASTSISLTKPLIPSIKAATTAKSVLISMTKQASGSMSGKLTSARKGIGEPSSKKPERSSPTPTQVPERQVGAHEDDDVPLENKIIGSPLLTGSCAQVIERLVSIQDDDDAPLETINGEELLPAVLRADEIDVPSLLPTQVPERVIEEGSDGKELCPLNSVVGKWYAFYSVHPASTELVKKNEFGKCESMEAYIKRRRAGFNFSYQRFIAIDQRKNHELKSMISEALLGGDCIKLKQALNALKLEFLNEVNCKKEEATKIPWKGTSLEASKDAYKAYEQEEFEWNGEKLLTELKCMKKELKQIHEKKTSLEASRDAYKSTYLSSQEKVTHLRNEMNSSYEELMAANSWALQMEKTCRAMEEVVRDLTKQLEEKRIHYRDGAAIRNTLHSAGSGHRMIMSLKTSPSSEGLTMEVEEEYNDDLLLEKKKLVETLKPDTQMQTGKELWASYSSGQEFREWAVDAQGKCEPMADYIKRLRTAFKWHLKDEKLPASFFSNESKSGADPDKEYRVCTSLEPSIDSYKAPLHEESMDALIKEFKCVKAELQQKRRMCASLEASRNSYKMHISWQQEQIILLGSELKCLLGELMTSNFWAQEMEVICLDAEKIIMVLKEQIAEINIQLGFAEVIRKNLVSLGGDPRMIITFDISPDSELLDSFRFSNSREVCSPQPPTHLQIAASPFICEPDI